MSEYYEPSELRALSGYNLLQTSAKMWRIWEVSVIADIWLFMSGQAEKARQFRRFDDVQDAAGCIFRNNWKEKSSALAEYARLMQNAYPGNAHNLRGPFRCGCFVCQAGASNLCQHSLSGW